MKLKSFFFIRTCFLGGEKDLMVEVITEAFVQVPVLSDFCFVAQGLRGSVVAFFSPLIVLNLQERLINGFKFQIFYCFFFLLILCLNIFQFQSMLVIYHTALYRNWRYTGNAEIALPAESLNVRKGTSILCLLYRNLK